jgi:hypothetical protein
MRGWRIFIQIISYSGMNDFLLNRMLFERLRDRWKEQVYPEIVSLKELTMMNLTD